MIWSPELQEQADVKIAKQDHIKVSRKDWELMKEFRSAQMKSIPNHKLQPWISFGLLLVNIEMEQIGIKQNE